MSKGVARTLEAMIGASLGAGALGGASSLAFKPDSPIEWIDSSGEVHARRLSKAEKRRKSKKLTNAVMAGAALGAGGALGLSRVLRSMRTAAERKALPEMVGRYTGQLKGYMSGIERKYPRQRRLDLNVRPALDPRLVAAKDLLNKRVSRIEDLLADAKFKRDSTIFGGRKTWPYKIVDSGKVTTERFPSPATHEGQIVNQMFGGPAGIVRMRKAHPKTGLRGMYQRMVEDLVRS